ncbi:MAG: MXAN_5187 C-terminal domain-containing protein [Acidimicrobiia bacterium]
MAPPKSDWEKQMIVPDGEIRRLEAEFNMFFAGRLPRPPWETKTRVAALIKKHDNTFIRNTADRFRFESLQSRYQKFIELCDRQLTNRELGRPMFGARRPEPAAPPTAAEATPQQAPQAAPARPTPGETVVSFGRDANEDRVKELYEQLAAAKKQVGETPVAYDRVAALVRAQVSKFADEGSAVAFKIALKDGKVSLTVQAEKGEGRS